MDTGSYTVRTDNSPGPSLNFDRKAYDPDQWNSGKFEIALKEGISKEDYPSTRTSQDTKNSLTPKVGDKNSHNGHKVGFSLSKHAAGGDGSDDDSGFTGPSKNGALKTKSSPNYMDNFKNMLDTESSPKDKGPSPVREISAADKILIMNSKKQPTAGEERENAERVDILLMELFPERYEKKKPKQLKAGKKGNAGYSKNQVSRSCSSLACIRVIDANNAANAIYTSGLWSRSTSCTCLGRLFVQQQRR